MLVDRKVSNRISGIIFRRSKQGKIWILLHSARATEKKHKSRKMQQLLPRSPRSWIAPTAKSYRSEDAMFNLQDCCRKKCKWQTADGEEHTLQLEERATLFSQPFSHLLRRYYWLLAEMVDDSAPYQIESAYFEETRWFDEETIGSLASGTAMTEAWKDMLQKALLEAQVHEADFLPLYRAFRDARKKVLEGRGT
jgi:hypothetical protein